MSMRPAAQAPPPAGAAIVTAALTRKFGASTAVDALSLEVPQGAFFGFLGSNGAGKSTTINMLTGLLGPTTGKAWILGHDLEREPLVVKRLTGVIPDGLHLFERLTGHEHLTFVGRVQGLDAAETERRARDLLNALELADDANKLIAGYSHGMRKKLALCCALIHNPRLLFLDEPFEGIDAVAARNIRELLARLVQSGRTTIFLTSHVLDIVERLCTHVGVIHQGRLLACGTLDELQRTPDGQRTTLEARFLTLVGEGRVQAGSLPWLG